MIKQISGILTTIGNTPLVKLERIGSQYAFNLYAKLEFLNPSGSLKDRAALNILKTAVDAGMINHNTTIIECSSGNFGIGLAMVCKYLQLPFICVIDPKVTTQNIKLLEAYSAEIILVSEPDPASKEFLPALLKKVKELCIEISNSFWPNQHGNISNARAHYNTMQEIYFQLNHLDYLFCATSSCGTLRGCSDYLKDKNKTAKIFAVDAEGSKIFSKTKKIRYIPGHGAGLVPDLFHPNIDCTPLVISAADAVKGCYKLLNEEAIFIGGSSGAIISAVDQVADTLNPGSNCVVILCDRGERYLDTIYSQAWVEKYIN